MISCFHPISDSYVVAGSSSSELSVVKFPGASTIEAMTSSYILPLSNTVLGKCSHHAVDHITSFGETVAAASKNTLSLWDPVSGRRTRHWATPDHTTTCDFVNANLVVAAGHGQQLHFYDVRQNHKLWSVKVAKDNLYTSAVSGDVVYAGGADGNIYGVDLRRETQTVWELKNDAKYELNKPDNLSHSQSSPAILRLKCAAGLVALLESGAAIGVGSGPEFAFSAQMSQKWYTHRVGLDVVPGRSAWEVVAGSENGNLVFTTSGHPGAVTMSATGFDGLISCVRWGPFGVFYCADDQVRLAPMKAP